MKKLIFLFAMLACMFALKAQTGTVVDKPNSVTFNYPSNKGSLTITKSHVALIYTAGAKITLNTTTGRINILTADFGFESDSLFREYLDAIINKHYYTIYKENSDSKVDSIEYHYISPTDTTCQHIDVMGFPSDTVMTSTIIPQ